MALQKTELNHQMLALARYGAQTSSQLKLPQKDATTVEALLNSGADINAVDENGNTALHIAVKYLQLKTVTFLLSKGANIEASNKGGVTPLQMAAFSPGSVAIFRLLLDNGANLDTTDKSGNTVLHVAAASNNISVIQKIVIENPAFHKIKNNLGNTPLHFAACFDNKSACNVLLENGADPNIENVRGQRPFDIADQWGSNEVKSTLEPRISSIDKQEPPCLEHIALKLNHPQRYPKSPVKRNNLLDEVRANYNKGDRSPTLLHRAIAWSTDTLLAYRHLNLMQNFLNKSREEGFTLRQKALSTDFPQYFQLKHLSEINLSEFFREIDTVYRIAADIRGFLLFTRLRNDDDITQPLALSNIVSETKKIYEPSRNVTLWNFTPVNFLISLFASAVDTLKFALTLDTDIWSDVSIPDRELDVYKLLYLSHLDELKPLIESVLCNFAETELVVELLDANFDINAQDEFGNTPLHIAAYCGHTRFVSLLLARGANFQLRNQEGKTPLEVANDQNHADIIKILSQPLQTEKSDHPQKYPQTIETAEDQNLTDVSNILSPPAETEKSDHPQKYPQTIEAAENQNPTDIIEILSQLPETEKSDHLQKYPQAIEVVEDKNPTDISKILSPPLQTEKSDHPQKYQKPLVSEDYLEKFKQDLLNNRSWKEKFVDWVHANSILSFTIAVFGVPFLFLPTIAVVIAALSDSSEKRVDHFINEFSAAAVNRELDTTKNSSLFMAMNQLPESLRNFASEAIKSLQTSVELDTSQSQQTSKQPENFGSVLHNQKGDQKPYVGMRDLVTSEETPSNFF